MKGQPKKRRVSAKQTAVVPRMGRPTKLSPELTTKIVEAVRAGLPLEAAAALHRVSKSTVYSWMATAQGPNPHPDHVDFLERFEQSRAEWALRLTQKIEADPKGGKGPLALLNIVHPNLYSIRVREITNDARNEVFRRLAEALDPASYLLVMAAYGGSFKAPEQRPSAADVKSLQASAGRKATTIQVYSLAPPPEGVDPGTTDDRGRTYLPADNVPDTDPDTTV